MNTQVKFVDEPGGGLDALEVRAPGPSSLMLDLVRELFRMRVEVLIAESRSATDGQHGRLRLRDAEGRALSPARRAEVQAAVLDAVERLLHRRAALSASRHGPLAGSSPSP